MPRLALLFAFSALSATPLPAQETPATKPRADILLVGGTIHDGLGGEPFTGDVAIRKDRILSVGTFDGEADLTIDCRGLIVAPGFIDLHNHSDKQVVDRLTRANVNFLMQGCTTIVTGNCGSGPVNAAEYHRQIDAAGAGTNVAHLLPQGSLREAVLGTDRRPPTAEEREKMRQLAEQAMRDGVWGMSTGLIYVPSSYATTEELIEIAKVVGQHGSIYASHLRGEGTELLASVEEALRIGREAHLPVHISHFKSSGRDAWGLIRQAAARIEKARGDGQKVTADQYPYIASSTSLEATVIPTWARAGGQPELLKRLDHAETSGKIREEMADRIARSENGAAIRIARFAPRPDWAGKSLAEIAQANRRAPLDVALEITRAGGAAVVNFSMNEDDVRFAMALPWVATASDGRAYLPGGDRPHPRSYGTFPRKIGHYAIDQKVVSLGLAIRSATGLPAEILGLTDRGTLRQGHFADIVVFDADTFRDAATFESPHQYGRGVRHLLVNGERAIAQGHPTGALAGRALLRPAKAPLKK